MTYWSNAYVVEWNRKIFPSLKNKAFCKRLKRWVEFCSLPKFMLYYIKIIDGRLIIDDSYML